MHLKSNLWLDLYKRQIRDDFIVMKVIKIITNVQYRDINTTSSSAYEALLQGLYSVKSA
jgi:hypothetical protein